MYTETQVLHQKVRSLQHGFRQLLALFVLTFALFPIQAYELEPIVVTGTRTEQRLSESSVYTEVISRKEIEASGARTVAEILNTHTGVSVSESVINGSTLQMQGLASDYVLVLVDGQRATGRLSGAIDLSRFSTSSVDHIEIVKGSSSAIYGSDALGGVINIITRKSRNPVELEAESSYGSLNYAHVKGHIGLRSNYINTGLTANFRRRDSYDLDTSTVETNGRSFDEVSLSQKTKIKLSHTISWDLGADALLRNQAGISSPGSWPIFDISKRTQTYSASFGPEIRMLTASKFKLLGYFSAYRDQYKQDMRGSSLLDKQEQTNEDFFQASAQYDQLLFGSHLITSGAEISYEQLESDRLESGSARRNREAIYVQDEWTISESHYLVFLPGIRADHDSQFGQAYSPKASLRFDPHEAWTIRTGVGYGFKAPDFKELHLDFHNASAGYTIKGNPNLGPETSRNINLNLELHPSRQFRTSLNTFRNDIQSLITTEYIGATDMGKTYRYANRNEAYTQGIETSMSYQVIHWFTIGLGYMYLDTRDLENNRPLEGRSPHQLNFHILLDVRRWGSKLSIRGQYFSKSPYYQEDKTISLESYILASFKAEQELGQHFSIFIGGNNLLNSGNPQLLPIEPFTLYGGMKATY